MLISSPVIALLCVKMPRGCMGGGDTDPHILILCTRWKLALSFMHQVPTG